MTPGPIQLRLLGPVEITADGARLAGTKQRLALTLLAIRAGQVVPTDVLVDLLWSDGRPADPQRSLQVHLSNLRGVLDRAGLTASRAIRRTYPRAWCSADLATGKHHEVTGELRRLRHELLPRAADDDPSGSAAAEFATDAGFALDVGDLISSDTYTLTFRFYLDSTDRGWLKLVLPEDSGAEQSSGRVAWLSVYDEALSDGAIAELAP